MHTTLRLSPDFIVTLKRDGEIEVRSSYLYNDKEAPKKRWKFKIAKDGLDYIVDVKASLYNIIQEYSPRDFNSHGQECFVYPIQWHRVFNAMKEKAYQIAMEYVMEAVKGA